MITLQKMRKIVKKICGKKRKTDAGVKFSCYRKYILEEEVDLVP